MLEQLTPRPGMTAAQQQHHERLLRVQAILSLFKHHRLRTIQHRIRYFRIAVRRQAMHKHRISALARRHHPLIHLERL